MKCLWIEKHRKKHRKQYLTRVACAVLGVSRSRFYDWRRRRERPPGPRRVAQQRIDQAVAASHAASHGIYGARKIVADLQRNADPSLHVCRATVRQSMRRLGLASKAIRRRRPRTTQADPHAKHAPNLLDRDFDADAPDRKWAADITYIPTDDGWAYLAVILDLFSRKIVGWAMAQTYDRSLVIAALHQATRLRGVKPGLLHHSDRGSQYSSAEYARLIGETFKMTVSMSRVGDCWDNAVVESFNGAYKREWMRHASYHDLAAARLDFMRYANWYNHRRLHQTLGYVTPDEHEAAFDPERLATPTSASSQPVASQRGEAVT